MSAATLFVIGGVGFALLPVFIVLLVTSFRIQMHVWEPSQTSTVASLPRGGSYAIRVRRHRSGMFDEVRAAPILASSSFRIQRRETGEDVHFAPASLASGSVFSFPRFIFWFVGSFRAPASGDYWISAETSAAAATTAQPGEAFVIGRRPGGARLTLLITGIVLSFGGGLAGIILGALKASGHI